MIAFDVSTAPEIEPIATSVSIGIHSLVPFFHLPFVLKCLPGPTVIHLAMPLSEGLNFVSWCYGLIGALQQVAALATEFFVDRLGKRKPHQQGQPEQEDAAALERAASRASQQEQGQQGY